MHRREFLNKSLLAAGTAVACPMLLANPAPNDNELNRLTSFVSTKPWNFDAASKYLVSLGHHQIPVLRAAMRCGDSATCCLALCMAKGLKPNALSLLPELVALAQDDQSENWFRAVIAIGKIGPSAQVAAPVLEQLLESPDPLMQLDVVTSLIQIQPSRLDGLSHFVHRALDQLEVVLPACRMVGELEERGRRFVPQLESIVFDNATEVRPDICCEAARAIYKITHNSNSLAVQLGVHAEIQLLTSPDHRIRRIALSRQRTCGPVAPFSQTRSHKTD